MISKPVALLPLLLICTIAVLLFAGCGKKEHSTPLPISTEPQEFAIFDDPIGVRFIPISGGTTNIGVNNRQPQYGPEHSVTVGDFYIAETELTVAQWTAYFKSNTKHQWGMWDYVARYAPSPDCPMLCIDKADCDILCRYMTLQTKRNYRLPTEQEWEYCARVGDSASAFDDKALGDLKNVYPYSHPVKSLSPNSLGLYGMLDNAWEWTSSLFAPYPGSSSSHSMFGQSAFVLRGGGFRFRTEPYIRNAAGNTTRNYIYGVRLVRDR